MKIYDQNIWGNFASGQCIANRNILIKEMIFENRPDFCCFQECNPKTSRSGDTPIQRIISSKYTEILPDFENRNFTPLFYNAEKVKVLDCGFYPFKGLNDINSKSFTWGVFEEIKTRKKVAVTSTHFWWKSQNLKDDEQREKNAEEVFDMVRSVYNKYNVPVLVAGDLNCMKGKSGYKRLTELGMKDVRYISNESDFSFTCSNEYPVLENGIYTRGATPEYSIDHIFLYGTELVDVKKFSVINSEKALASSDHLPLILEFELRS